MTPSARRTTWMIQVAWVAAVVAPVALIGGWTVAALVQPAPYDSARDTISALAQLGQPHRWVMTAGLAVAGIGYVLTAAGLVGARAPGRLLLALGGVCTAGVAVFPLPSDHHATVAFGAFLALALWPALSGVPGRLGGVVVSVVLLALVAVFALGLDGGLVGLSERALAGAEGLWPLVALAAARRRDRGGAHRHQASNDAMSITKR